MLRYLTTTATRTTPRSAPPRAPRKPIIGQFEAAGKPRAHRVDPTSRNPHRNIVRKAYHGDRPEELLRRRNHWAALAMSLALALTAPACLRAQEVPLGFFIGPGEIVEHDSNLTRVSEVSGYPILSDTSYTTDLMGTFHETYGRQDVAASAMIGRVLYQHLSQFNLTEEDIHAALKSTLPYNIATSIRFSRTAELAHFADIGSPVRDVIDRNEVYATIDFPLAVDWRSFLAGDSAKMTNSSGLFVTQNLNTTEADAGVRFQPITGNHVDLLFRTVHGTYPNGSPSAYISPGYNDRGADLRADWTFSGASHLQGRAGYVERRNDVLYYLNTATVPNQIEALNRDFSGPAFDLTYIWQISGASKITLYGLRETGASGDNSYLSAVTKTFRITPAYLPTAKLELDAYFEWSQRNYFSNVYSVVTATPAGTTRLDNWHNAGLSVLWSPRRWIQFKLEAHREQRDSNIAYWTYVDNVASLTVQSSF